MNVYRGVEIWLILKIRMKYICWFCWTSVKIILRIIWTSVAEKVFKYDWRALIFAFWEFKESAGKNIQNFLKRRTHIVINRG